MDVIKVERRNEKAKAKQLRRSGLVPCCVYGGGLTGAISIQMDRQTANQLFRTKREGSKVSLELDGRVIPTQIKEKKRGIRCTPKWSTSVFRRWQQIKRSTASRIFS